MSVITTPQWRLLLLHHILELVQAENAIAVGVVLGEDFFSRVIFDIFGACSLLLPLLLLILPAFLKYEVV